MRRLLAALILAAALTGCTALTPDGQPVRLEYRCVDPDPGSPGPIYCTK